MRRLACLFVLFAGCVPEEAELSYPIRPISGPSAGGSTVAPDADTGSGTDTGVDAGAGSGVDLFDGGIIGGADAGDFPQDAGPFLDAFTMPPDAPAFPGGDQIP